MTWSTDRGGARRLGSTRESVQGLDGFREAWDQGRGGVVTDLVAGDERVYAACSGGTLHAFDAGSGRRRWTVAHDAQYPTLCLGADRLFLRAGSLLALDPASGDRRWERDRGDTRLSNHHPSGRYSGPTVGSGGALLVADDDGVAALDPATGDRRWRAEFDERPGAPASADGLVFVGTEWDDGDAHIPEPMPRGTVHALDAATGEGRWETDVDGAPVAPPAVGDGRVHVGHVGNPSAGLYGHGLTTLDAATGDVVWTGDEVHGAPVVSPDGATVAAVGWDGTVLAVDAATGASSWRHEVDDETGHHAVATGATPGAVYRFSAERRTAFDVATGAVLADERSYSRASVTAGPAIAGGGLFLGDRDGRVVAFGAPGDTRVYGDDGATTCPSCGTALDRREASFCSSCGAELP